MLVYFLRFFLNLQTFSFHYFSSVCFVGGELSRPPLFLDHEILLLKPFSEKAVIAFKSMRIQHCEIKCLAKVYTIRRQVFSHQRTHGIH